MEKIKVLRLGHRPKRDKRLTTHVGLVSRAFGADELILDEKDEKVRESIKDVNKRFGEGLSFRVEREWKKYLKNWEGIIIHLSMYGQKIQDIKNELQAIDEEILVVVGAEKVPAQVYEEADYNVAITNQPHSEVAALCILLDRLFEGEELDKKFNGEIKIVPSKNRKIVKEKD